MEDLLECEHNARKHALTLLKGKDVPYQAKLDAFSEYRAICQSVIFADYRHAERIEQLLWDAHVRGRGEFGRLLRNMRRDQADKPVETRVLAKAYLRFLKDSEQHYRNHLNHLACASGGDPHLLAVARQVKGNGIGESQHTPLPSHLLSSAYDSCYQTLNYLGDLSRYRVESELDNKPSFASALGYYELAVTFRPSSGWAHNQQAIVALKTQDHLTAIYRLYRSITLADPSSLAPGNLDIEVDKTNTAWDKNELISKGLPNDPDASKRNLVGWFIRMHSTCFKGEPLTSHAELEREVFSQLANVIKQRDLDRTLMRMVLIGIAAQYCAGDRYKENHLSDALRDSYMLYLRSNIRMFTTLLDIFYQDLRSKLLSMDDQDVEMAAKLTTLGRRLLPSLRVFSNWLMSTSRMITGLVDQPILQEFIPTFWASYARALDLIAQAFPIFDLEDMPEVTYLLDEDDMTMDFLPLTKDSPPRTRKTWYTPETGAAKSRGSDENVVRVSPDDEMLQRIRDFLFDGVNLANGDDGSDVPIYLQKTRVFYNNELNIQPLIIRPVQHHQAPIAPPKRVVHEKPKPTSWASIAATAAAQTQRLARREPPQSKKAKTVKNQPGDAQDAQMNRMVDDLLDEPGETNNPATPPQQLVSNPAVVSDGEAPFALEDSAHDLGVAAPKYANHTNGSSMGMESRPNVTLTPPAGRPMTNMMNGSAGNRERLHSISKIWDAPGSSSSFFPSGLPTGTLGSPPMDTFRGHSRVNSASSVRSRNSLNMADPWDPAPRAVGDKTMTFGSPLLFGAGGGPWSTPQRGYTRNTTPPNGQGG